MQHVRSTFWMLRTGIAFLILVCLLAPLAGAAGPLIPAKNPPPVPAPPAFPALEPEQVRLTASLRVLGGSTSARLGPWQAVVGLYAGEDPQFEAWSLQGPFSSRSGRLQVGTTSLFLNGFQGVAGVSGLTTALPELGTLQVGDHLECWALLDTDQLHPIPKAIWETIEDRTGIFVGTEEATTYAQIITRANYTSHRAFMKAARKDVTYGHLFNHPEEFRGQIVHVEGRLKRVIRVPPMFEAANEGVHDLFVGYIFNESYGPHPYRVIFTEWPAKLPRSLLNETKIDQSVEVAFAGYFYKRYRYEAADSKGRTRRDAPMLIGHSLTVLSLESSPDAAGDPSQVDWAHFMGYVFLGLLLSAVALVIGLTVYFRRADRRVRGRLLPYQTDEFIPPPPDAAPVAAPVGASGRLPPRVAFPLRQTLPPGFGDRGDALPESGGGKEASGPAGPDEDAGA
jgi:hypothetical protein